MSSNPEELHLGLTARLVRRFLEGDKKQADDAFTTAVVHDVGEIVLALSMGEDYARIRDRAKIQGLPSYQVEAAVLGVSHAEIGAYLLGLWGLPFNVVEAVAYHHRPADLGRRNDCRLLAALHVADALSVPRDGTPAADTVDEAFLDSTDCRGEVGHWRRIAAEAPDGVRL